MSTTTPGPGTDAGRELLDAVIEQVMRSCADLDVLVWFTDPHPQPPAAATAVGRLLRAHPHLRLVAGSPLAVWAGGGRLDPQWRSGYPVVPDSAWANLQFLTELYDPQTSAEGDGAGRLLALKEHAMADLAS